MDLIEKNDWKKQVKVGWDTKFWYLQSWCLRNSKERTLNRFADVFSQGKFTYSGHGLGTFYLQTLGTSGDWRSMLPYVECLGTRSLGCSKKMRKLQTKQNIPLELSNIPLFRRVCKVCSVWVNVGKLHLTWHAQKFCFIRLQGFLSTPAGYTREIWHQIPNKNGHN